MAFRGFVTNQWVADQIGISNSMVSKIRSGDRFPSFNVMLKIEKAFNWDTVKQIEARKDNKYQSEFEDRLTDAAFS